MHPIELTSPSLLVISIEPHPSHMFFQRLRTRLACFLSRLRSTMSKSSALSESFLRPALEEPYPVSVWARDAVLPHNLELTRSSRIVRVRHCKSPKNVNHEALELQVEAASTPSTPAHMVWLLVERGGGIPATSRVTTPLTSTTSLDTTSTTGPLGNMSSSLVANDRVVIPAGGEDRSCEAPAYRVLNTLVLPADAFFSLTDAAALLPIVSAKAIHYKIFKTNCYWYCAAIRKAIHDRYGGKTEIGCKTMKAGFCGPCPVPLREPDDDEVQEEIRSAWTAAIAVNAMLKSQDEVSIPRFLPLSMTGI